MHPGGRPATLLLLGLVSATTSLGTTTAASAATVPKRCSALHGKDLLPGNPAVRVVRVRVADRSTDAGAERGDGVHGHAYYGCTSRGSRVRRPRTFDLGPAR